MQPLFFSTVGNLLFSAVELCCRNKRPQNTSGIFAESQTLHIVTVGVLGGEAWFLSQHSPPFFKMYASPSPTQALTGAENKEASATQRSQELLLIPASSYTEQQSSSASSLTVTVKLCSCYPKQQSTDMLMPRIQIYLKCHTRAPFIYTSMVHLTRKKIKLIKLNHWNHFKNMH